MVNATIPQVLANMRKNIIQIAYEKVSSTKQQQDSKRQYLAMPSIVNLRLKRNTAQVVW